jgi:pyruvate,water dikinase
LEWAIEDGRLYVLQSRPITTLSRLADPDGLAVLWDNANIVESYSGVTTPLTFSFARTAYEGVYRQFARLMSVPQRTIDENANTFRHMLGLLRGRVYYNLLNWYRVLAMLPGFQSNRRFMEQMMGVREPLPEPLAATLAAEYEAPSWFGRMTDRLQLALAAVRLAGRQLTLPKRIREFQGRVDAALAPGQRPLEDLRLDELVAEYRQLESRLVTRWDAPLVNDFFTMIYFGLVRSLARQWCGDDQDGLCRELVSGHRELVSAEPAKWIERMARLAADWSAPSPAGRGPLLAALCEGSAEEALARIAEIPELEREFQSYLEHSGDRCLEELKLESPTLADDPLPLVRAIGRLAMRLGDGDAFNADRSQNSDAQQRVARALRGHPLRRLVFRRIVRRARRHVRDREALRFERTRVFGRVRRIVVEIGRRLVAEGSLDDARDVFYLELHEVLGFAEGTISCPDLRALTSVRKAEFARYREAAPPAGRCETRGAVHVGNDFLGGPSPRSRDTRGSDGTLLEGIGCCRGVVRGRVRVVRDPRSVTIAAGEILVAEQTDPGWVMLFPAAAGVLVERGSLLSHSAVLARELGIPTIVAIADLTSRLSDGDYVEVDGTSGTVRILRRAAVASSRRDAADEVRRYRTASSAV